MKRNSGRTKLTALSILATLAYCLLIFNSFADGWDDFKLGFEEGLKGLKVQTYFVDMKAKESFSTFPDSIPNIKTGKNIHIRYDKAQVRVALTPNSEKCIAKYQIIQTSISFIIFFIVIYIPILFFKLMRRLTHEVVFDRKNISYLRKIAISLLVYFLVNLILNYIYYLINFALFNFNDYTIQKEPTDMIWPLLAVVLLLFTEILSKGSKIQEEQKLTI